MHANKQLVNKENWSVPILNCYTSINLWTKTTVDGKVTISYLHTVHKINWIIKEKYNGSHLAFIHHSLWILLRRPAHHISDLYPASITDTPLICFNIRILLYEPRLAIPSPYTYTTIIQWAKWLHPIYFTNRMFRIQQKYSIMQNINIFIIMF